MFAGFWTWLHILQFCTANQCVDPEEDALNKPWRPIPAGLISIADARTFHLILLPLCLCLSVWLGPKSSAKWHSISWALAGLAYNGFHFHAHWLTRNVGCAWLYGSLNAGAAIVAAGTFYVFIHPPWTLPNNNFTHVLGESGLTTRTAISVAVNSLIIFSTLQSQDFRDLVGDTKTGRWTLPMVWPTGSRISMLVIMTTWSVGLSRACDLAHLFSVPFCMWAAFIGTRFIQKRTPDDDQQTYNYFNVRLYCFGGMCSTGLSHSLPCRCGSWPPKWCILQ